MHDLPHPAGGRNPAVVGNRKSPIIDAACVPVGIHDSVHVKK
jgi:hypothetical protein